MHQRIAARIKRLVTPRPSIIAGPYDATVIAVCASKGGVGKTTTAVHLAAGLATLKGRRTLVVDLDPQGHVGRSLAHVTPRRPGQLADLLMSTERQEVLDVAVATALPNLHLTAPDRRLAEADKALTARIGREFLLRRATRVTRTHYEYIVLDCPPNLGNLTLNALLAAHALVVPCDPSPLSVQGVTDLLDAVDVVDEQLGYRPALLGILKTRVDRRSRTVHDSVGEILDDAFGPDLFQTEIGVNTALTRAQIAGTTVWATSPGSRGAADYAVLVDEVLERLSRAPLPR